MGFSIDIANDMVKRSLEELDLKLKSPVNTPILIILGGQPGSGKSNAIEIIESKFNKNIIALNGDDVTSIYEMSRKKLNETEYLQISNDLDSVVIMMQNRDAIELEIKTVIDLKNELDMTYDKLSKQEPTLQNLSKSTKDDEMQIASKQHKAQYSR